MANELAAAYIALIPTTRGIEAQLRREFVPAAARAGDEAGRRAGGAFSSRFNTQIGGLRVGLRNSLGLAAAGLGLLTVSGLKSAAALEQTQVAFSSLLGSSGEASQQIKDLQAFAARTPFSQQDVFNYAQQYFALANSVGLAKDQVQPFLTAIGDVAAVTGASTANIHNAVMAIGQIGSAGKVTLENLNQISEAFPGFNGAAAIAAATGQTTAQVLKEISSGTLDATTGVQALIKGMQQFPGAAGAMAKQSETLTGLLSTFKDTINISLVQAFQPLIPTVKTTLAQLTPVIQTALVPLAQGLSQILSAVAPALAPLLGGLGSIIKDLFVAIGPLLPSLGELAKALADIFAAVGPLLDPLAKLVGFLSFGIGQDFHFAAIAIEEIAKALTYLRDIAKQAYQWMKKITSLGGLLDAFGGGGPAGALGVISRQVRAVRGEFDRLFPSIGHTITLLGRLGSSSIGSGIAEELDLLTNSANKLGFALGVAIARIQQLGSVGSGINSAISGQNLGIGLGNLDFVTPPPDTASKIDQVSGAISRLQERLTSLRDSIAQEASNVAGTVRGTFNIAQVGSLFGEPVTLTDIKNKLANAVRNAKRFIGVLKRLAREGLSRFLIQQLAEAGPDALPQAEALLTATPKELRNINSEFKQLSDIASTTGHFAANEFFQAGILAAQGLVNGMKSQDSALTRAMRDLANRMVREMRNALGIHSPSRVAFGIGENFGRTLGDAIGAQADHVGRNVKSLANQAASLGVWQGGVNAGANAAAGGGVTVNIHAHNPLPEPMLSVTTPAAIRRSAYAIGR